MSHSQAYEAIRLAQVNEHRGRMPGSAKLAAADAVACFNRADYRHAFERACMSLAYSVGVFGTAYQTARGLGSPRPLSID